jgi:hypothetical protein
MKIAVLIPSTSKGRDWATYKDTYLYEKTLKTLLLTYDNEHNYRFYIGIDEGDRIYDNESVKQHLYRFVSIMKNVEIEFVYMTGIPKGHLTVMWNRLFLKAYDAGFDYFFQCGDDIEFKTSGWTNACIDALSKSNEIGVAGPINNNARILTQSFVSRKHMDLFGYYFPPEIINWCCDDWINDVYKLIGAFYPLQNHLCINVGGAPRYDINNDPSMSLNFNRKITKLREDCTKIVQRDVAKIMSLIQKN